MTYEAIRLERDARGVATVTLARADKHNAMNAQMMAELSDAARALALDEATRIVVLAADGRTFCAGGDLNWMREQAEKDRAGKLSEARVLADMLGLWFALPKPVIARVQGAAYGGGIGLACVSDIVIAATGSRFALTETRLGLSPATIGPFVASKLGPAFTSQVFLNGKPFDTEFALRAGMVARVVEPDALDAAIEEECEAFLQCAPGAVAEAKALARKLSGNDIAGLAGFTTELLVDRWETEEAMEGIAAFFAKRPPSWRAE